MNEVDNAVVADCIEYGINAGIVIACLGVLGYLSVRQTLPKARRRPMTLGEALLAKHRKGFTLLEMLVSVAITMIVMLAIAQIFMYLGNNMDKGRALIEMSGQLRNVTHRLQQDLDGMTASTLPWTKDGDGYFEYVEGAGKDADQATTMWGDRDDVLMFTARSKDRPFVGRHAASPGGIAESQVAEIIWWVSWRDAVVDNGNGDGTAQPNEVSLHRRVLLIRPDLTATAADDISRSPKTGNSNSLADLTLRENRTLHNGNTFPHLMNVGGLVPNTSRETVLNNVVGFDVRVYDPLAPIANGASGVLIPGDPGYVTPNRFNPTNWPLGMAGRGAYVDLNYAGNRSVSLYSGLPNSKIPHVTNAGVLTVPTYSTWPVAYEHDGIDQDGDGLIDEGRDIINQFVDNWSGTTNTIGPDGIDDSLLADDNGERETVPPYPSCVIGTGFAADAFVAAPGLRGIQVRIRMAEPGSRQVRQSTVVSDFLPE